MKLTFVTGNPHKAEMAGMLLGYSIEHKKVHLDEIQTIDLVELVEHKARQAFEQIGSPVIVDDFGFGFKALGGLPGPFTKFFIEPENGAEMMCRMIDGFKDRSASVTSAIGYCDGDVTKVFIKSLNGTTADTPRGTNGIHTDQIFIPEGYEVTRAELTDEEYAVVYEQVRPYDKLRDFLRTRYAE